MAVKHNSPVPPDGGWGWVVVVGSSVSLHFALFIRCIGVFFNEWRQFFDASATAVGVVGSVHLAAFLFMGPLAGYLCNRIGSRKLAILGGMMTFTSFLVTSYAKTLLHIILSFGVLGGVGCGFVFVSAVTIITKYFKKRYATAHSISNSGSGLTIVVLPLLARFLIDLYSWDGAMFILAAASANMCVCGMLFRPLGPSGRELSDEERPRLCKETGALSLQDEVLNGGLRGSRGNVYRKISSTSDGQPGGSEKTDLKVKENPDGKPHRKVATSSGTESGSEGVVKTNNGFSEGKPQKKVSICPDYIAETEGAVNLKGVSDGQLQRSLSESYGCSSDVQEGELPRLSEVSVSGAQLNGVSVNLSARMEQRRPTMASIYLGHIARGSGLFLLKTRFRFSFLCLLQAVQNIAFSSVTIHFVPMTIEAGISKLDAAVLMSISGVGSLFGRLALGQLIDCKVVGSLKIYFFAVLTCGVAMVVCPSLQTFAGYLVFALVFGFMSGTYKSLSAVLIREFVGADLMPLALGIFMPFIGIGIVTGPTLAGWLYDIRENYDLAFYITGSILVLSSSLLLLMPYLKRLEDRRRHDSETNDALEEELAAGALRIGSVQSLDAI
ncbi:monocarboxylate transporter 14-like [Patiria miniata]|uniref:Major facilitator superfamily (MFS) profile domain-containing protein n=1 Tax=Patiria miniata TaxID=46514 RepID=A0A913ZFZ7_PATMI|nr:monocarboxylate transporter 14-like [Patiria miniata]XP_038050355.1 monocarboxylate transporter 14-like [Patiria miniata]XP_038050356.1 monocarboxylate transporter 14-like [Patiria miniata]